MKKKNRSLLILTIAVSLVVGFLTGMLVDFPKTDNTQLSGTIGRVQNYKNVKVTEKDIIDFCKEHLASYKVPKIIDFRDILPKSPVGKLMRHGL